MILSLFNDNSNISFTDAKNNIVLPYVLKDLSENCSCFITKCNMMQYKHIILLNQKFNISKIGLCYYQRKNITLSKKQVIMSIQNISE